VASDLPPFSPGDLVHLHSDGCYDGIGIVVALPRKYTVPQRKSASSHWSVYAFDQNRGLHRIMRYYLMEITPAGDE